MQDAQLLLVASSLAYTTILAIVPVLAVAFSIFKSFGGLDTLYSTIEPLILENLAKGSGEQAMETLRGFVGNIHAGKLGATGMIGLIFTTMSMFSSAERAINDVWKVKVTRSIFSRVTSYWFFISLGPLAASFALGATSSKNLALAQFFPKGTMGLFTAIAIFFIVYKWTPNRNVKWHAALVPAILTALLWHSARWGYSVYTSQVVTYHKIYGSLGAIPIILLWIYIVWVIVLAGAAFSATLQNQFDDKKSSSLSNRGKK